MQKCRLLCFFKTSATALHHALWLGHIIPESNISHRWAWTSFTNGRGICLNNSLNGASLVTLITCSVNEYNQACRVLRRKCHGTQPRETWWYPPALVAKTPIHTNLTSQTACFVFALWSASVPRCLGPHPMCLSFHLWFWHLIGSYHSCTGIFFFRI